MADVQSLVESISAGDVAGIRSALLASPELARARDANGISLICLSVYLGQRKVADQLSQGRNDLDIFEASTLGDPQRLSAPKPTSRMHFRPTVITRWGTPASSGTVPCLTS